MTTTSDEVNLRDPYDIADALLNRQALALPGDLPLSSTGRYARTTRYSRAGRACGSSPATPMRSRRCGIRRWTSGRRCAGRRPTATSWRR